jgi:hypothetical protein
VGATSTSFFLTRHIPRPPPPAHSHTGSARATASLSWALSARTMEDRGPPTPPEGDQPSPVAGEPRSENDRSIARSRKRKSEASGGASEEEEEDAEGARLAAENAKAATRRVRQKSRQHYVRYCLHAQCAKEFRSWEHLTTHAREVHSSPSPLKAPTQCSFACGLSFVDPKMRSGEIRDHILHCPRRDEDAAAEIPAGGFDDCDEVYDGDDDRLRTNLLDVSRNQRQENTYVSAYAAEGEHAAGEAAERRSVLAAAAQAAAAATAAEEPWAKYESPLQRPATARSSATNQSPSKWQEAYGEVAREVASSGSKKMKKLLKNLHVQFADDSPISDMVPLRLEDAEKWAAFVKDNREIVLINSKPPESMGLGEMKCTLRCILDMIAEDFEGWRHLWDCESFGMPAGPGEAPNHVMRGKAAQWLKNVFFADKHPGTGHLIVRPFGVWCDAFRLGSWSDTGLSDVSISPSPLSVFLR